jgi:hypothetical protein
VPGQVILGDSLKGLGSHPSLGIEEGARLGKEFASGIPATAERQIARPFLAALRVGKSIRAVRVVSAELEGLGFLTDVVDDREGLCAAIAHAKHQAGQCGVEIFHLFAIGRLDALASPLPSVSSSAFDPPI